MNIHSSAAHSPRHRRAKPGAPAPSTAGFSTTTPPEVAAGLPTRSSSGVIPADWQTALGMLEQIQNSRLAQIEERLAATERTAADLAGQIKEMR
jgi:hypothetical protein